MRSAVIAILLVILSSSGLSAEIPPRALELRNEGIALLENEQPAKAEKTFRALAELTPKDPLPYANLAIAHLRQQRATQALAFVDKALGLAPDDPERRARLLFIKSDVLQWANRATDALATYRRAAELVPRDVEIHYALYRQATSMEGEAAEEARRVALDRLVELRPENLVVLLARGQRAIATGDRTTATAAFMRIGELLWQAPEVATETLEGVLAALEENELDEARIPAIRLENVLKVTPMYQQGLRELSIGIQGVPVWRFVGEPAPADFGEPVEVSWKRHRIGPSDEASAVVVEDFDGDERADVAWIAEGPEGDRELRVARAATGFETELTTVAPGVRDLLAVDLDNDGAWDLLGLGERLEFWKGGGDGSFSDATEEIGLTGSVASAATVFDFDIDGDLDLVLGHSSPPRLELLRNNLDGELEPAATSSLPRLPAERVVDLEPSDTDRDGDVDLLVAHRQGIAVLDNLRQGEFRHRRVACELRNCQDVTDVVTGDFDNDGDPDLVTAGERLVAWENEGGSFAIWAVDLDLEKPRAVETLDLDNDGRLDLVAAGDTGLVAFSQRSPLDFTRQVIDEGEETRDLAVGDLDGDGDVDVATAGPRGLSWYENRGGNENRWLTVRLKGLTRGNSKNNTFGLGATVEVADGGAYQYREVKDGSVHFGLGERKSAGLLRVVWTNGVPQNRLDVEGNQWIVEEQVLKGSCPFLYAWNGDEVAFVTDLLWGAPAGLPLAPGVWASADPRELVKVAEATPRDGVYDLRITEELWEAAFFDEVRLWIVDHPDEVEVASSLKIVPGETVPETVHGSRGLRPVAAARDGRGEEVTAIVSARDEVYAAGYAESPYQGVAARPWTFAFDLGEAPDSSVRLHLDGWIFPADASLNLAVAQRRDLRATPPRLEVETAEGWRVLMADMGFPAGKTKTMVVDTPSLPEGASRLRIVTGQWLHWDRIAWTTHAADGDPVVRARLSPEVAELRYRGFSAMRRLAPNAPHVFDYDTVELRSPWLPFPGRYTRYGDVRELLETTDDRHVVLAPGDELRLRFDATGLPPIPRGWSRTVFLESFGWDKDADRNTYAAGQMEPLPFAAMDGYPYDGDYPETEFHRRYRDEWLTRVIEDDRPLIGHDPSTREDDSGRLGGR